MRIEKKHLTVKILNVVNQKIICNPLYYHAFACSSEVSYSWLISTWTDVTNKTARQVLPKVRFLWVFTQDYISYNVPIKLNLACKAHFFFIFLKYSSCSSKWSDCFFMVKLNIKGLENKHVHLRMINTAFTQLLSVHRRMYIWFLITFAYIWLTCILKYKLIYNTVYKL